MYTSIFFPGYLGPGIINVRKMFFLFIISEGGRLSGMTNTGQQLYEAVIRPKGLNPSVPTAIRQCLGSLAFSQCFHQSASMLNHPMGESTSASHLHQILFSFHICAMSSVWLSLPSCKGVEFLVSLEDT